MGRMSTPASGVEIVGFGIGCDGADGIGEGSILKLRLERPLPS
jgi:hypothetical protein